MDVSIILINYNTYDLTVDAINSVFDYTTGLEYEIILVDNQSPDNSGEKLSQLFEDRIKYIQSGGNLGTSKAFNLGLKHATGKYILWLNTDILIRENFISKLYEYMEANCDCGICGGNILDFEGNPTHSFDELLTLKFVKKNSSIFYRILKKFFRSNKARGYNYSKMPIEVGYISGADMMVRKSLFDELGGLDENIFMYAEEVEFAHRVKQFTNYKIISIPNAHIYHLEGASFKSKNASLNERRFKTQLDGECVYFIKVYGKQYALKYLKWLYREQTKLKILNKLLMRRDKANNNEKRQSIIKEKINSISI